MSAIWAAAHPLPPDRRSDFLEDVAHALANLPELGDGALHRVIMAVQKRYFDPPQLAGFYHAGKHARERR